LASFTKTGQAKRVKRAKRKSSVEKNGGWGDGGGTGAVSLAEAIASFLSMVELDFERNGIGEGGGRAQAETLRLNTTLTSLSLHYKSLGEGGGRG
jgi:hypothetical protein